jgi:hypothetical protein
VRATFCRRKAGAVDLRQEERSDRAAFMVSGDGKMAGAQHKACPERCDCGNGNHPILARGTPWRTIHQTPGDCSSLTWHVQERRDRLTQVSNTVFTSTIRFCFFAPDRYSPILLHNTPNNNTQIPQPSHQHQHPISSLFLRLARPYSDLSAPAEPRLSILGLP